MIGSQGRCTHGDFILASLRWEIETNQARNRRGYKLEDSAWLHSDGWPIYRKDLGLKALEFFAIQNELSTVDGLLLRVNRIIISSATRKEILEGIHDRHLGITKCQERANQGVWWPWISKDIQNRIITCRHCLEKSSVLTNEHLLPSTLIDNSRTLLLIFVNWKNRLVSADYKVHWHLHAQPTYLECCYQQYGIAETVVSDNRRHYYSLH